MDATPVQILTWVTRLLDTLNIPYMIDGSFASSVHGIGRHTRDADLVVDLVFKTPEDTILRKLEWYRAGGEVSEQQWRDVLGVLAVGRARLDDAYPDRWAASLQLADLLARARRE